MSNVIQQRLDELELALPDPPEPAGAYVPTVVADGIIVTAGMLPLDDGQLLARGRLGAEIDLETGVQCARQCALNALAAICLELGNLDRIQRILRVEGFVASTPDFLDQAAVMNGASHLLVDVFGDVGVHTRFAVGAVSLPLNAPVELAIWAKI